MPPGFLSGVVEGFYGPPWSHAERLDLLTRMAEGGLDTYVYAPKDDLKHRAAWREPYTPSELEALGALARACRAAGIRFVYALSPGLDIRYAEPAEIARLVSRLSQVAAVGADDFALLFDDVPGEMRAEDGRHWPSFAAAQCHVANAVHRWAVARQQAARLLFCPTPYCGRMAERGLGGTDYLDTLGRELASGIDVFWTGPEIVSREITVEHVDAIAGRLRRRPVIWDNLFANDYDGRRFYCGPYAGRPPSLRGAVRGLLLNPNTEHPLNHVPLRTFSDYLASGEAWDPRAAYLRAMAGWRQHFQAMDGEASLDDLVLFGDAFYLPYSDGPSVGGLLASLRGLLGRPVDAWGDEVEVVRGCATRLRAFCARVADLRDRQLFYALHRRAWELREELDLVLGFLHAAQQRPGQPFRSDFHLPGTCRGGVVSALQALLRLEPDGRVTANPEESE